MWFIRRGIALNLEMAERITCDNNNDVMATYPGGKTMIIYTGKDWERFMVWLNNKLGAGGAVNASDYVPSKEGYR